MSRVLIAEDYLEVSKMYQIALEHTGYSVFRAGDGLECLRYIARQCGTREKSDGQTFAAVILDCRMPHITCAEVANEILVISKHQRILIAAAYIGPSEVVLANNRNIRILQAL